MQSLKSVKLSDSDFGLLSGAQRLECDDDGKLLEYSLDQIVH